LQSDHARICIRCRAPIAGEDLANLEPPDSRGVRRLPSGLTIITRDRLVICAFCGCTDELACTTQNGFACFWYDWGGTRPLCSACYDNHAFAVPDGLVVTANTYSAVITPHTAAALCAILLAANPLRQFAVAPFRHGESTILAIDRAQGGWNAIAGRNHDDVWILCSFEWRIQRSLQYTEVTNAYPAPEFALSIPTAEQKLENDEAYAQHISGDRPCCIARQVALRRAALDARSSRLRAEAGLSPELQS